MTHLIIFCLIFLHTTFIDITVQDKSTPDQEIETVVSNLFEAMRTSDGDKMRSYITENATLHTVAMNEGEPTLRQISFNAFIESINQTEPGTLDEQLTSLQVHTDDNLATVWVEYRFYLQTEFSHCGVNTVNLLKKSSGWKIFSIVDTRRRQGC